MEKFMLIFQNGAHAERSPEEIQATMGKWMAWIGKLSEAGKYVAGEPLLPGGKVLTAVDTVTDGPYAEGKEVIGGYFIVHAENYDDAVAMCSDYPDFGYGGKVHVRQVMKMDM